MSTTKIRLVLLVPDFMPGGAQKQVALLLNSLGRMTGEDSQLEEVKLVYVRSGPNIRWVAKDCESSLIKIEASGLKDVRIVWRLWRIVLKNRSTHIYSWLHPADTYCWLLKMVHPKLIWIMAERDSDYPAEFKYRLRNMFGRFAQLIVANSEMGAEYWRRRAGKKARIAVIGNIFAATSNLSLSHSILRDLDVVSMGRLEKQKRIIETLDALLMLARDPNLTVEIVGQGSLVGEVEKRIESSGLRNISFRGYVDNGAQYLSRAKVFVTLSGHEGTPNALVESILAGCIAVVSRIPEHVAILGEFYPFYIRSPDDHAEVASALASALKIAGSFKNPLLEWSGYKEAVQVVEEGRPDRVAGRLLQHIMEVV